MAYRQGLKPRELWHDLSYHEVICFINARSAQDHDAHINYLHGVRILGAQIRSQYPNRPISPQQFMKLPGDDVPQGVDASAPLSKEAAVGLAKAMFVALGGKLDENGNPIKRKKHVNSESTC